MVVKGRPCTVTPSYPAVNPSTISGELAIRSIELPSPLAEKMGKLYGEKPTFHLLAFAVLACILLRRQGHIKYIGGESTLILLARVSNFILVYDFHSKIVQSLMGVKKKNIYFLLRAYSIFLNAEVINPGNS